MTQAEYEEDVVEVKKAIAAHRNALRGIGLAAGTGERRSCPHFLPAISQVPL